MNYSFASFKTNVSSLDWEFYEHHSPPPKKKKKKNEASSHLPSSQKSLSHHLILRPVVTGWLILLMHSMDLGAWWCHSSNWDHFLWPTSCIFPPIKTCLFFHNPLLASIIQHYFPTEDDSNYLKGPVRSNCIFNLREQHILCAQHHATFTSFHSLVPSPASEVVSQMRKLGLGV